MTYSIAVEAEQLQEHLGALGDAPETGGRREVSLRTVLVVTDVVSLALAWGLSLSLPYWLAGPRIALRGLAVMLVALPAIVVAFAASKKLYLSRVCTDRVEELRRLLHVAVAAGVAAIALGAVIRQQPTAARVVTGTVLTVMTMVIGRTVYLGWLRHARFSGCYRRRVVIIGANPECLSMVQLFKEHPELGTNVVGVVGESTVVGAWPEDPPILGGMGDALSVVLRTGATGAIVMAGALSPDHLSRLSGDLVDSGIHVHISTGLHGIDHRRMSTTHVAWEPLIYLSGRPSRLSRPRAALKRGVDIVLAGVVLLITSPLLLVAAAVIKISDRGSVIFRQVRIGRDGVPFVLFKLRTMVPDAEILLDEVLEKNERRGGPLFKVEDDPRRTRVGRILARASIDELPQLVNVLRGEMSLVGPRPALAVEVAEFDPALREREKVRPGVTGLWQVQARDLPCFSEYRRLDIFYVENWSLALDLAILIETAQSLLSPWIKIGSRLHRERMQPDSAVDSSTALSPSTGA